MKCTCVVHVCIHLFVSMCILLIVGSYQHNVMCCTGLHMCCTGLHTTLCITSNNRSETVCDVRLCTFTCTYRLWDLWGSHQQQPSLLPINHVQQDNKTAIEQSKLLAHYYIRYYTATWLRRKKRKIESRERDCENSHLFVSPSPFLILISSLHPRSPPAFTILPSVPLHPPLPPLLSLILLLLSSSSSLPILTHPFLSITLSNKRILTPSLPSKA